MEVRLTRDYRGKETREVFYKAGSCIPMTDEQAARLLSLGFAEPVADDGERLAYPALEDGSGVGPYTESAGEMPKADAIAVHDNALIAEAMKAQQAEQVPSLLEVVEAGEVGGVEVEVTNFPTVLETETPAEVQPESAPEENPAVETRKAKNATKNPKAKRNN